MKLAAAALLSILATTASSAQSTTRNVADIVYRHVAAIGGQNAVRSLHDFELRLIYTEGTFSAQSSLAQARPYFRLVSVPAGPLTKDSVLEGYDGAAWEYYGDPGVVLRTVGSAGAIVRRNAHQFIDPLVDAADNRTTLKYLGDRVVDRKNVSTVSARFSDGTIYLVFVDRTTYLIDPHRNGRLSPGWRRNDAVSSPPDRRQNRQGFELLGNNVRTSQRRTSSLVFCTADLHPDAVAKRNRHDLR